MRDKNPMDELRFYAKNAPDIPIILRKDEASNDEVKIFYDLLIQHFFWVGCVWRTRTDSTSCALNWDSNWNSRYLSFLLCKIREMGPTLWLSS